MFSLKPEIETPPRPSPEVLLGSAEEPEHFAGTEVLYIRSYLLLRALIGFIGVALPGAVVGGDLLLRWKGSSVRGSLSSYYYFGTRDVFIGALCAIALFLVTYKAFEHNLDNTASTIAGVLALGVALFPTHRPKDIPVGLTLLQERLGESTVAFLHFLCAVGFIGLLGVISFYFGVREGRRPQAGEIYRARRSPIFWRRFHWTCTAIIALAIAFFGVSKATGLLMSHALLITETVAVLAFGASWLLKGLELDVLVPRATTRSPNVRATGQIAVSRANGPDNAKPLRYRATDIHDQQ